MAQTCLCSSQAAPKDAECPHMITSFKETLCYVITAVTEGYCRGREQQTEAVSTTARRSNIRRNPYSAHPDVVESKAAVSPFGVLFHSAIVSLRDFV